MQNALRACAYFWHHNTDAALFLGGTILICLAAVIHEHTLHQGAIEDDDETNA